MDPVTLGTLIGAITSTVIATADQVEKGLSKKDGEFSALLINTTPHKLTEFNHGTIWGGWNIQPSNEIEGQPTLDDLFEAWKMSNKIPPEIEEVVKRMGSYEELDNGQGVLFADWSKTILKNIVNPPGKFSLIGRSGGIEAVTIYRPKPNTPYFCFYIAGGGAWVKAYAGCAIIDRDTLQPFIKPGRGAPINWQKLSDLIEYSTLDGESYIACSRDGDTVVARNHEWSCTMGGGLVAQFTIRYGE